jgi:hypothetical protein
MAIELFKKVSPNDEKEFNALLKIVDSALTNAGGKILVKSQLDKGTEFLVYLKTE